jgi:DNA processing protein
MTPIHPDQVDLLRLSLTTGLGPTLGARLLELAGSPAEAVRMGQSGLERVKGIGRGKAPDIARCLRESADLARREIDLAETLGVRFLVKGEPQYPSLLAEAPQAPLVISLRGEMPAGDLATVAIVGSRRCTAYGIEQSERFAGVLARSGMTIVSGGARGIDTAAHRGALRAEGRTIAVLGCGLARCYPPDNEDLFNRIVDSGGAIVSELPLQTEPDAKNFPARNRIISGLSLGVIVIEASKRSGALITARIAAEDHGREVMGVPGRVDSSSSEGVLELIRSGGASLVASPGDVLETLEGPAHLALASLRDAEQDANGHVESKPTAGLTETQQAIMRALESPRTFDELAQSCALAPEKIRAEITMLEIQKRIVREGSRVSRRAPA